MSTKQFFEHKVELTDAQIIERAHLIAKATAEINRIEEEKKQIPILRRGITNYSRQIENGYIEWTASGEFHWNTPSEGKVLITPVEEGEFEPFTREMTLQEKQEHSQLEIVFEKPEADQKPFEDIYVEGSGNTWFVRSKSAEHGSLAYYHKEEQANRFMELLSIHQDIKKVHEIMREKVELLSPEVEEETAADHEDDRDLAEIFGTNEEETAPQKEYYIEPSTSKVLPWQITRRNDDDPFIKTAPVNYFRTKEEAEEHLTKMLAEKEAAK